MAENVFFPDRLVCPICRKGLIAGQGAFFCGVCNRSAVISSENRRLDFSPFLEESRQSRRVGVAYKFYSKLYAPLALINMIAVWRASLGKLVKHYRSALSSTKGEILDVAVGDGSLANIALGKNSGSGWRPAKTSPSGRFAGLGGWPPRAPGTPPSLDGRIVGLDISRDMLDKAVKNLSVDSGYSFVLADAGALPYRDESFSSIACYGGLHVIAHPSTAIKAMFKALKRGGSFHASILTKPRGRLSGNLAANYVQLGFLSSNFTCTEAEKLILDSGLKLNKIEMNGWMLLVSAFKE